jgi:hypothetical protein
MKPFVGILTAICVFASPSAVQARGCIKGAVIGGIAGHFAAHHGLMGAVSGCIVGRHEANRRAQLQRSQRLQKDREIQSNSARPKSQANQ